MEDSIVKKFKDGKLTIEELEVIEKALAKKQKSSSRSETSYYDSDGNLVALRCWAFQRWFLVDKNRFPEEFVEFGKKASLKTGFNSMCREACSRWYQLNNESKKALLKLLDDILADKISKKDAIELKNKLERQGRDVHFYKDDGSLDEEKMKTFYEDWDKGFDTLDELRKTVKEVYKLDI